MTPSVGVLGEVGAQAPHGVREPAHTDADERALLCPDQLFLTVLHTVDSLHAMTSGLYAMPGLVDIVFPPHRLPSARAGLWDRHRLG